jgi:hypothetical protein
MNANELMIGNYIDKRGDKCKIASIHTDNTIRIFNNDETDTWGAFALRIFEPIPITEQWLLDFGFIKDLDGFYRKKTSSMIEVLFSDNKVLVTNQSVCLSQIKSVNQLQNLYFSLTGIHLR